jgi:hypothetical protein
MKRISTKHNKKKYSSSKVEYVAEKDIKKFIDIVARRGAQNFHDIGHQRYLDERDKYHIAYVATKIRKVKQKYQNKLIKWVENRGGRFLVPIEKQPGMYRTLTCEEKQTKVGQHLREKRKNISKHVPPTSSHPVPINNSVLMDISVSNFCINGVIQGTMIQGTGRYEVNVDNPLNSMNDHLILAPSLYQDDDMELLDENKISMLFNHSRNDSVRETNTTVNHTNDNDVDKYNVEPLDISSTSSLLRVVLNKDGLTCEDWSEVCDAILNITDDDIQRLCFLEVPGTWYHDLQNTDVSVFLRKIQN